MARLIFYEAAKKRGVKPIIGCEVYVAPGSRFEKTSLSREYAHLVLLCKDMAGYKNLMKLVSAGSLEGFYYKPRIDYELLAAHSEGLVCLSACLAGDVQRLLMQNDYQGAKRMATAPERYVWRGFLPRTAGPRNRGAAAHQPANLKTCGRAFR